MSSAFIGRSLRAVFIVGIPLLLAYYLLGLNHWDMSVPLIYGDHDEIWQLVLTKVLKDTGWVLYNPYLGAPDIASWHHNAAAQTSALHSILMLALSPMIDDAVRLQQTYYFLNFALISVCSYVAGRLLGINRLSSFCMGVLFAFTSFRINYMFWVFITDYFVIPLSIVSIVFIFTGRFESSFQSERLSAKSKIFSLFRDRFFLLCILFVVLTALSDGYYAFFTLLLLGFAVGSRTLLGGWRHPIKLIPGLTLILALLLTSLMLQLPLTNYKKSHYDEFYPNGVIDSSLIKQPFEAEVYSTSLKMMIAPIGQHRIQAMNDAGQTMIKSSDEARAFKSYQAVVPLGSLGSLLLAFSLIIVAIPSFKKVIDSRLSTFSRDRQALSDSILSISSFIFICSIFGGVGTLIALVFPTIRAYDRFPIFLLFVLYLGAGFVATIAMDASGRTKKMIIKVVVVLITCLALYDQTPTDSFKGKEPAAAKFLAERNFVHNLESALPSGAMVYQYPYSQYLRENKYYGWGSFAHVRTYLHSNSIRWSNGGAKNSPADNWNNRISKLPFTQLLTEVQAVGFKSVVIDRTVVKDDEYSRIYNQLHDLGYTVTEDKPSGFSVVALQDPGYRITYDKQFTNIESLYVTSKDVVGRTSFPTLLDADKVKAFIDGYEGELPITITRNEHLELFVDSVTLFKGTGDTPVAPYSDMKGSLECELNPEVDTNTAKTLSLTLTNRSFFRWTLGSGSYPIKIGYHTESADGALVVWDNGYRVSLNGDMNPGESKTVKVPFQSIHMPGDKPLTNDQHLRFALVQDGSAWFAEISCVVKN